MLWLKQNAFWGKEEFHVRITFSCSNHCDMTNSTTETCEVNSAAAGVVGMTVLTDTTACAGMGKQHWMNLNNNNKNPLDDCQVSVK